MAQTQKRLLQSKKTFSIKKSVQMQFFESQIFFCIQKLFFYDWKSIFFIEVIFFMENIFFCLKQLLFWLNYKDTNVLPIIWPKHKTTLLQSKKLLQTKNPSLLSKKTFSIKEKLCSNAFFRVSTIYLHSNTFFLWLKRVFWLKWSFFYWTYIFWLKQPFFDWIIKTQIYLHGN